MQKALILLLAGTVVSFGMRVDAEVLELKNGAKLIGVVVKEEGGKITFKADLIGEVVIDAAAVAKRENEPAVNVASTPPSSLAKPVPVVQAAPEAAAPPTQAEAEAGSKVHWKRTVSVSGSYNSATYTQGTIPGIPAASPIQTGAAAGLQGKQSTLQVSALLVRATATNAFSLQGSYGYAKYEPAGAVLNNHMAEMTFTRIMSPKWYWLTRATYKVDKVSLVDHAFEEVVGVGRKLIDEKGTSLDIIPGVSFVNDKKGTAWDDKWIPSVGFLENFDHSFNERVSMEQRFKYRVGISDSEVWAINAYLGLNTQLSEHVSFTVGATYTYDNTLGPLPATLVPVFVGVGLPPAVVAQLRPTLKDQLLITSGVSYDW